MTEINKKITTSFDVLSSHVSALIDETKNGEGREKSAATSDILTSENLLQTVEEHNRRLDLLDSFADTVSEKMERAKQRYVVAGPSRTIAQLSPPAQTGRITSSQVRQVNADAKLARKLSEEEILNRGG